MSALEWQITNATVVLPEEIRKTAGVVVGGGRVQRLLESGESEAELLSLNLHGLFLFPGFINAHDSLLATYHAPDVKSSFNNWLAFDNELKASALFRERMLVEVRDLYWLGAYRNLIGGATTVADHIPHFVRAPFQSEVPVYLLEDYGISHSVSSYSLEWGDGIRAEYDRAEEADLPYIIHIAEGFDPESKKSLRLLDDAGGLGEHTVLVHGLSLSEEDLDRVAAAGAHLVWCPTAGRRLYNAMPPVAAALRRGINIALGTDSAMTGSLHLPGELQAAHRELEKSGGAIAPDLLYHMITTNGARAFRLDDRGVLSEGGVADMVVLRGKYPEDPFGSLLEAGPADLYLVARGGMPLFGDTALAPIFSELGLEIDEVKIAGTPKIIVKGMKNLLESIRERTGNTREFSFLS
jgi:cytosine/adenosine deaminase-related metal-dependent hydrolase